jgi:2-dehydropantoate 2-reductase
LRVLILGAGAIGSFVGAQLGLAGYAVTLIGRDPLVSAVHEASGLVLYDVDGRRQLVPGVSASTSVADALGRGDAYDLTLLAVKAYDTATATAELEAAGARGPVLTLQNGIGNEEMLSEVFGADAVIAGAIDTPVSMPAPGTVQVHRTAYRIGLAPVGRQAPAGLAALALSESGFDVRRFPDYRSLKWTKLLMNMLANAACAILDWSPAQVMRCQASARLEARAWQEALAVMAALAIRPVSLGGYPFPLVAPLARAAPPGWLAHGLSRFVAGGRGSKMPSLQIALGTGKPSEVNWLNGAVVRSAAEMGLPAPVNGLYTCLLTELTTGMQRREDYRDRPDRLAALAAGDPV